MGSKLNIWNCSVETIQTELFAAFSHLFWMASVHENELLIVCTERNS